VAATGADLVVGNADKARIADLVDALMSDVERGASRIQVSDLAGVTTIPTAPLAQAPGRSRAFVKIQEGCQHRCAFCIVPLARGASRSQEPEVVLDRIRRLVETGHPEVVLTGVDLGHYGADLVPRTTLAALLARIVEIPGLRWVRLSSVLPAYVTAELTDVLVHSPLVAPHFHIPLQSGSDRILRSMRRPYNVRMYRQVVERLVDAIPSLGLGTDVIAGFPGERDPDFDATRALLEELPFTYLHVFAYSDRSGTEASRLGERVDGRTITDRSADLRALSRRKNLAFRRGLVGETRDVLVLESRDRATGNLVGLTGNYVEVVFDGPDTLMRSMVAVTIIAAAPDRTDGALA
jgi:threonylcarbamoyladenosine tRNA methylthiotransferase MtaB